MSATPPPTHPVDPEDQGAADGDSMSTSLGVPRSVARRTIVQGAAWTIPVVAVAVGAPLAAASPTKDYTLVFDNTTYTTDDGCEVTGVSLTLTDQADQPAAAQPVTVTLPTGWTFPDGSSTGTFTTDANGQVILPTITAAPGAGTFTLAGTTPLADPAAATVEISNQTTAYEYAASTGKTASLGNIPAGAVALGSGFYQYSNGDIYSWNNGGSLRIAGAGAAVGYTGTAGYYFDYIGADGFAYTAKADGTGPGSRYDQIPLNSTPVGGGFFLAPNGDLYQWNKNAPIATGVTSASGYVGTGNTTYAVDYVDASGGHTRADNSNTSTNHASVPAGSTAVGTGYFLQPNGTLRFRNTAVATGVASAVGYTNVATGSAPPNRYYADIVYTNGTSAYTNQDGSTKPNLTKIPSGATPLGGGYFLVGEDLYSWQGGGKLLAHRVTSAVGYSGSRSASTYWGDYVVRPSGCLA